MRESTIERMKAPEQEKAPAKSRAVQKVSTMKARLKTSLEKALPAKAIKKQEDKTTLVGKAKVQLKALGSKANEKLQEIKAERAKRDRATSQKAEKAKAAKPPVPVMRRK